MPSLTTPPGLLDNDGAENDKVFRALRERVKELTALHGAARVLEHAALPPAVILQEIVELLPPAWQYPEITAARLGLGAVEAATPRRRPIRREPTACSTAAPPSSSSRPRP